MRFFTFCLFSDFSIQNPISKMYHFCFFIQRVQWITYPEELFSGSSIQSPISNLRLLSQILCTLDGWNHPFHSEEGSQVGRVGGDDNQSEEPPHTSNYTTRERSGGERAYSLTTKQVVNSLNYSNLLYQIRLIMKCLISNIVSISSCAKSGKITD